MDSDNTTDRRELLNCLRRIEAGEQGAHDELLQYCGNRLELLARKMLKTFPHVRRWAETGDVVQNSMIRLLRALDDVKPDSVRHLLALAATQIRRELIDLTRKFQGPQGVGARHESWLQENDEGHDPDLPDVDDTHEPCNLAQWCELHEQIAALPDDEREVCELLWYQGLGQGEAAEVLETSVRTVKRRWQSVRLKLHKLLDGQLP